QARGDRDVDARADLFALGCVLYECLAGAPAFRGDSVIALRAKVLLHDPPRLTAVVPEVPPVLEDIVMRMISRDIDARPHAAAEVEAALGAVGEVRASRPRIVVVRSDDATRTSTPHPGPTCAVLLALEIETGIAEIAA